MNAKKLLRSVSLLIVVLLLAGNAAATSFTVTVMPESSTTWYAGYLDEGYQSESDDPLAPFSGQAVMFKGYILGGSSEMLNGAYLVARFKIEFDQDVAINSVSVFGAGDNVSLGNNAVLRLLDENMNEFAVEPLTGFNVLSIHKLNAGGVLGRTFYIDEFDFNLSEDFPKERFARAVWMRADRYTLSSLSGDSIEVFEAINSEEEIEDGYPQEVKLRRGPVVLSYKNK